MYLLAKEVKKMPKINIALTVDQSTGTTTPIVTEVADDVEWVDGPDGKRRPGARVGKRQLQPK